MKITHVDRTVGIIAAQSYLDERFAPTNSKLASAFITGLGIGIIIATIIGLLVIQPS
jgi:tetrahydromethanopterin S-methyltransferase subunit F